MKSGYILDLYAGSRYVVLWVITGGGRVKFRFPYRPYFFIRPAEGRWVKLLKKSFGKKVDVEVQRREDLREGSVRVLRVIADSPATYRKIQSYVRKSRAFADAELYNIHISPEQMFAFERGIFPFGKVIVDGNGVRSADSPASTDYDLPCLRVMRIRPDTEGINPKFIRYLPPLIIEWEGREMVFDGADPEWLEGFIRKADPDLIITDFGDEVILPAMIRAGIRSLCRDGSKPVVKKGKSFMSYGEIVYRASSTLLKGRIHIDRMNSFFYSEVGLEGIVELSRISFVSAQVLARTSVGTPMTAIEIRRAFEEGYLIPYRKNLPEDPKRGTKLLEIDRGGLSFRPVPGVYENVAEYDFFSMYPSIIAGFNLSYETINCPHRECTVVLPFAGYRVCTKREGIVPKVLRWLISRRRKYKKRIRELDEVRGETYRRRQNALKWLLVVSFGYLGYKNAVFGRIESHEATTAIGRELLLHVKEMAELKGFRVIHALTDAIWIHRNNATEEDYKRLEKEFNESIKRWLPVLNPDAEGLSINLEGIYHWIVFCPSKEDGTGVPNRYFGKFKNGELKFRGIALRRRDTPGVVRSFQKEALEILAKATNREEFFKLLQEVEDLRKEYILKVEEGRAKLTDLIVYKKITRKPHEYKRNCDTAQVVCTLAREGFSLEPGDRVAILYTEEGGVPASLYFSDDRFRSNSIDRDKYSEFLREEDISYIRHYTEHFMGRVTGLEPATWGSTVPRSTS